MSRPFRSGPRRSRAWLGTPPLPGRGQPAGWGPRTNWGRWAGWGRRTNWRARTRWRQLPGLGRLTKLPGPRRSRLLLALASAVLVLCCCGGLWSIGMVGVLTDHATQAELLACGTDLDPGDQTGLAGLDPDQRTHGQLIVEVGRALGVPPRGWVIAVATAMQESGLRNLPHLGARNDHDSLGLFQQRPSQGWGTPEQILDPEYAATAFYERLVQVPDWEQLPLTAAADAVQRSAYPDAYAKHEPLAVAVVNAAAGGAAGAAAFAPDLRCALFDEVTAAGWTRPADGPLWSGFRTANRPDHYGIDIGAARGAPVRAAADGVVTLVTCNASLGGEPYSCDVDGSPSVAGCGWYVNIQHGDVLTRYCHLLTRPQVEVGEQVVAGQLIGLVGSSGHSSGPHLHFEVELRSAVISADGVTVTRAQTDPAAFLAARGVAFTCASTPVDCRPAHGDRVWTETR